MKHLTIKVSGSVQGVFFRASTKKKADELSIKGTVRNERDGSVFIEAEGEDEKIEQFLSWCRTGPPSALVKDVLMKEAKPKHFHTFEIVRL